MATKKSIEELMNTIAQLLEEGKDPCDYLEPEDLKEVLKAGAAVSLRPKDIPIIHDTLAKLANSAHEECDRRGIDLHTPSGQDEMLKLVGIGMMNLLEQIDGLWGSMPDEKKEEILTSEYYEDQKAQKCGWDPIYG